MKIFLRILLIIGIIIAILGIGFVGYGFYIKSIKKYVVFAKYTLHF